MSLITSCALGTYVAELISCPLMCDEEVFGIPTRHRNTGGLAVMKKSKVHDDAAYMSHRYLAVLQLTLSIKWRFQRR